MSNNLIASVNLIGQLSSSVKPAAPQEEGLLDSLAGLFGYVPAPLTVPLTEGEKAKQVAKAVIKALAGSTSETEVEKVEEAIERRLRSWEADMAAAPSSRAQALITVVALCHDRNPSSLGAWGGASAMLDVLKAVLPREEAMTFYGEAVRFRASLAETIRHHNSAPKLKW